MSLGRRRPVVASWRGDQTTSCGIGTDTVDFVVEGDLTGYGDVCGCAFAFTMEYVGGDLYDADVDFGAGCFARDGHYECELSNDTGELDCGLLGSFDCVE